MKKILLSSLLSFAAVSCSSINLSESLDDANDPLNSPLSNVKTANTQNSGNGYSSSQSFSAGTWVETAMPDAGFYKKYPRFGGKPTKDLPVSTIGKVISTKKSYTKIELNSGEVGYVSSIMLIEKVEDSYTYAPPEESIKKKRTPIVPKTSDPAPPTEDEILAKIKAREEAKKKETPQINVPTAPTTDEFVAPEPEIQGIKTPTASDPDSSSVSPPPPIPSLPTSIPQVAPPEESAVSSPSITPPSLPPVEAPAIEPVPTPPADTGIKINKPVDTSGATPINAPAGGKINQDAALELRITEPFKR